MGCLLQHALELFLVFLVCQLDELIKVFFLESFGLRVERQTHAVLEIGLLFAFFYLGCRQRLRILFSYPAQFAEPNVGVSVTHLATPSIPADLAHCSTRDAHTIEDRSDMLSVLAWSMVLRWLLPPLSLFAIV